VHLVGCLTAEKGLCGRFKCDIAKKARAHAQKTDSDGKTGEKIPDVGKKG